MINHVLSKRLRSTLSAPMGCMFVWEFMMGLWCVNPANPAQNSMAD